MFLSKKIQTPSEQNYVIDIATIHRFSVPACNSVFGVLTIRGFRRRFIIEKTI